MSLIQQWQVMLYAFGIKPLYMTLSLLLIVWIWRQKAADLTALRWGLIWFWLGETACSIDYIFYAKASHFWEYIHGFGMAVGFSFIAYAVLEGLDQRLIKFSPGASAVRRLAVPGLRKVRDEPCGLKRLFKFMIPALMLVSFMPLTAPFQLNAYRTELLGRPTTIITWSRHNCSSCASARFWRCSSSLLLGSSCCSSARSPYRSRRP